MVVDNLNQRISKIIEYSELTSSEFADEVEVQRSSISHITSGRNRPSLDFLVKVKNRFPELEWEWLITGEGEMTANAENTVTQTEVITSVPTPTALPDLFSLIGDEDLGYTESEDRIGKKNEEIANANRSELKNPVNSFNTTPTAHSQQLENASGNSSNDSSENQKDKVKRVVLFFESGKFESYEQ